MVRRTPIALSRRFKSVSILPCRLVVCCSARVGSVCLWPSISLWSWGPGVSVVLWCGNSREVSCRDVAPGIWQYPLGGWRSGQLPLLSKKVTCLDFSSFIFIFHFRVHFLMLLRWVCRLAEAVMGLEWLDRIAVSSAKCLGLRLGIVGCQPCRVYRGRVPVRYLEVHQRAWGLVARCYYCM